MDKHLTRSRKSRVLTGVCGGLGEYFRWDPVWVRLAFVAGLFLVPPVAAVGYLALWIAVPRGPVPAENAPAGGDIEATLAAMKGEPAPAAPVQAKTSSWGPAAAGVLLVLVGVSFFVPGGFLPFWEGSFRYLGAAALALVAGRIAYDMAVTRDYSLFRTALAAVLATVAVYLVFDWPGWGHYRLYLRYAANLVPAFLIIAGLGLLTRRTVHRLIPAALALAVLAFVGAYSFWGGGGPFFLGWD